MVIRALLFVLFYQTAFGALAATLPEKIEQFRSMFERIPTEARYDIRVIQGDYPTSLLSPDSMLPQTAKYPLKALQKLYQYSEQCQGILPVNPLVTDALVFSRALCKKTVLPTSWFVRSSMIHPGGGTYASRYIQAFPERMNELQHYMHIKERPFSPEDTLLGRLQRMDNDAIAALISGSDTFISEGDLWIRKGSIYRIFKSDIWQVKINDAGLELFLSSESDANSCYVRSGNICWEVKSNSQVLFYSILVLGIVNVSLIAGWGISRWNHKRKDLKDRMLVLQILTHELRTPIASLSLTVEGFRREFEALPESVYDEFRRLCEDTRRLRQLAEASKDYLQSDHQALSTEWIPSVTEWLDYRYEENDIPVEIIIENDSAVKVNIYWLGTCIDNLVNNACKYGEAPISLQVTVQKKALSIRVMDQGKLTRKNWKQLRQPFVSKSGLGLGLTIVDSMVKRMGGTMKLIGPPTTFILEIPCETDTIIS